VNIIRFTWNELDGVGQIVYQYCSMPLGMMPIGRSISKRNQRHLISVAHTNWFNDEDFTPPRAMVLRMVEFHEHKGLVLTHVTEDCIWAAS
jgi:hypothetical protein